MIHRYVIAMNIYKYISINKRHVLDTAQALTVSFCYYVVRPINISTTMTELQNISCIHLLFA